MGKPGERAWHNASKYSPDFVLMGLDYIQNRLHNTRYDNMLLEAD
jgi:hypothetical protein